MYQVDLNIPETRQKVLSFLSMLRRADALTMEMIGRLPTGLAQWLLLMQIPTHVHIRHSYKYRTSFFSFNVLGYARNEFEVVD